MIYHITDNEAAAVALKDIPEVDYAALYNDLKERLQDERYHVAHYFATPDGTRLKFFLILLDRVTNQNQYLTVRRAPFIVGDNVQLV